MNRLAKVYVTSAIMIAVAAMSASALAGEAVIIPSQKGKTAPLPDIKSTAREIFKLPNSGPGASPFDVLTIPMMPDQDKPLDPRDEKRRRLQRLEEKNWMMVEKGELQAEEDNRNFLNVREYSLDGLEKQDDSPNLMFRPLDKDDARRMPGQFRSTPENARQQRSTTTLEESEIKSPSRSDQDPQLGAHMSSELNFRGMFGPRPSNDDSLTPKFNKSELTLHSLLNSGGNTELAREHQARREEFRNFLNKPASASPLAGPSDPINARGDFTRQPLNPTTPQPFGGLGSSPVGGNTFGAAPNISRPNSGFSPALPTWSASRPSAGFAAGSHLGPHDSGRAPQRAPISFDPPKRKF